MTSATMLARLRTMLDEASAGFWSDAQIYDALTAGQEKPFNLLVKMYKDQVNAKVNARVPRLLLPFVRTQSLVITNLNVNLPSDYVEMVYASTGGLPVIRRDITPHVTADQNNSLLSATSGKEFYCLVSGSVLTMESQPNDAVIFTYISTPIPISATQQPIIPMEIHESICQFAFALLLEKDQRVQESAIEMQKFNSMIQVELN